MTADKLLCRRDVDFLLFEWLQIEALSERPRFAQHDRGTHSDILDVYEALARDLFAPHNKKNDSVEPRYDGTRVTVIPEVGVALAAFADAGLCGAGIPTQYGGIALPSVVERAGMAFLLAANIGTVAYAALTIANANTLLAHASPEQIARYVTPMIAGKCFGTMCLSEPQAGSSLADVCTRAVPSTDGSYRLFGNKMWISGGDHEISENIAHLVLAKIPDASGNLLPGIQGLSLFLVPKRLIDDAGQMGEYNDIALAGINHKMGFRGTVNCLLNFGEGKHRPLGAAGAVGEVVGRPGEGLAYMFHMMNEARISVGLGAAALAYTGYLHSLDYARSRKQGRKPGTPRSEEQVAIIHHSDVRRMLLAQKTYASGALALCLYAARLSDDFSSLENDAERRAAGLLLDLLTPVVKSWPSQWGLVANDLAIQVHGAYGYTREYNVEQFYRDSRLNPIHEGTFGIQALDLLGRKIRRDGGAALSVLAERVASTCALAVRSVRLNRHAIEMSAQWQRLISVTQELNLQPDEEVRLANASAYLEAFGHVIVAWLWLGQAVIAEAKLSTAALDQPLYLGKLAACDYFFGWELPRVESWWSVLSPIDRTVLNTEAIWL